MSHGHHERQELDQSPPLRPVRHGRTLREQKSKKLNTKTEKAFAVNVNHQNSKRARYKTSTKHWSALSGACTQQEIHDVLENILDVVTTLENECHLNYEDNYVI